MSIHARVWTLSLSFSKFSSLFTFRNTFERRKSFLIIFLSFYHLFLLFFLCHLFYNLLFFIWLLFCLSFFFINSFFSIFIALTFIIILEPFVVILCYHLMNIILLFSPFLVPCSWFTSVPVSFSCYKLYIIYHYHFHLFPIPCFGYAVFAVFVVILLTYLGILCILIIYSRIDIYWFVFP